MYHTILKKYFGPNEMTTPTKPLEHNRKVLIGIRTAYDIWIAVMLISLANDVETHPGHPIADVLWAFIPAHQRLHYGV